MKYDFFGHFSAEFSILGNKPHFFHGWMVRGPIEPDMDFLKLTYKNAAVLQHFWVKSIQYTRVYLQLGAVGGDIQGIHLFEQNRFDPAKKPLFFREIMQ